MTKTILSWDLANWWLTRFIVHPPWFRLSSFDSCPAQVPIFYRPSTVQEKSQTKVLSRWHGQTCPETRPIDGSWILLLIYHGLAWARLTLVLSECQHFTGPRQLQKEFKQKLFRDDTDNLVLIFGQLMAHAFYSASTTISPELLQLLSWTRANILPDLVSSWKISNESCFVVTRIIVPRFGQLIARGFYFGFTMVLPELVRLLSWTSANTIPVLDSSEKISSQGCLAMTRTILSPDSANW